MGKCSYIPLDILKELLPTNVWIVNMIESQYNQGQFVLLLDSHLEKVEILISALAINRLGSHPIRTMDECNITGDAPSSYIQTKIKK